MLHLQLSAVAVEQLCKTGDMLLLSGSRHGLTIVIPDRDRALGVKNSLHDCPDGAMR